MQLQSDLWLDQPDAHQRVDAVCAEGRVTAEEAGALHTFVDEGYVKLSLDIGDDFCEAFDADVSRMWRDRPADLAVSPPGPDGPTSFRDFDGPVRKAGYRIPDLHSHSDRARDLYLHPILFRMVQLIFGAPAIAFQSLYFEYGSQQALHRDPMFVVTDPVSHLVASWIALEDCGPDCGPLAYVPKSQHLPWFEFQPGTVVCGHKTPPERRREFAAATQDQLRERDLSVQTFTCRRGDAFIWHGGLLHGGTPIADPTRTRRSFVTHYSTAAHYRSRTAGMRVRDSHGWHRITSGTERVLERGDARGLENPLRA